ncbi:hypothetical protein HQ563_12855 [bacterium]|nr:hypothetical protein [bacterium]
MKAGCSPMGATAEAMNLASPPGTPNIMMTVRLTNLLSSRGVSFQKHNDYDDPLFRKKIANQQPIVVAIELGWKRRR